MNSNVLNINMISDIANLGMENSPNNSADIPETIGHNGQSQSKYNPRYNKVMDEYFDIKNSTHVGSLDQNDQSVGTALVGAPACGDVMQFQLKIEEGIVIDAKFKTFGCTSAIASSNYAAQKIIGQRLEDAAKITNKDIAQELKLPPVKLHCSVLAEEAIHEAIEDYKNKNNQ